MASVSLQNITKVFGRRVTAVAELSLDIRDGELMAIVGPSGCGKTTILRLLAGLETLTSGEIRLGDNMINDASPKERNIAMVFEDAALYPHMNLYDNLAFALRRRGQSGEEIRRRIRSVAQMLGIEGLLDRKPAAISGGQRQRAALGRAIVREPAVFLFDEPLSSLDAGLRLAMRSEIKALHQRLGATMLYVTHDQSEAMALGDRICVVREGRMQQVGRPPDIYDRPVNRFVAGFFGVPPMNFLTGRLRLKGGAASLEFAGDCISLPPSLRSLAADRADDTIIVGIRPQDLSLVPPAEQKDTILGGRVDLIELLGSRTDVYVKVPSGEQCIISCPPSETAQTGEEIQVNIDIEKIHLFDSDDAGLRLTPTMPQQA